MDVTLNPLHVLAPQDVRPSHQDPLLSRPVQAALSALPSTVIRHPNHDCVRTLKGSTYVKGQRRHQVCIRLQALSTSSSSVHTRLHG